jgi:transcriptional regulator with XRE-family HTH domain
VRKKRDVARAGQGRAIRELLDRLGWSQMDLVRATGLPPYTISRAVRGQNVVRDDVLRKIAKALKVDPDRIFETRKRAGLDDMPDGVHSTHLENGKIWVRMNVQVEPGIHLALEALANHDRPINAAQLARILTALQE